MTRYIYLDNSGSMPGKEIYRNAVAHELKKAEDTCTNLIICFFSENVDEVLRIDRPELVDLNKIMDLIIHENRIVGGTDIHPVYTHFIAHCAPLDTALVVSDLDFHVDPVNLPKNMAFAFADNMDNETKEDARARFALDGIRYYIIDIPKKEVSDMDKEKNKREFVASLEAHEIEYISMLMTAMEKISRERGGDPESPTRIEVSEIVLNMQDDTMPYAIVPSEFNNHTYSLELYKP